MADWGISKKLFVGTGALVVLLLVSGVVAYQGSASIETQLESVIYKTVPKLDKSREIKENAAEIKSEQRRVLLSAFATIGSELA